MRKTAFKQWLEQKAQGYGAVGNYPSQCERVDEQLGDLDAAYQQGWKASCRNWCRRIPLFP